MPAVTKAPEKEKPTWLWGNQVGIGRAPLERSYVMTKADRLLATCQSKNYKGAGEFSPERAVGAPTAQRNPMDLSPDPSGRPAFLSRCLSPGGQGTPPGTPRNPTERAGNAVFAAAGSGGGSPPRSYASNLPAPRRTPACPARLPYPERPKSRASILLIVFFTSCNLEERNCTNPYTQSVRREFMQECLSRDGGIGAKSLLKACIRATERLFPCRNE